MTPRLVLFDIDGTILLTAGAGRRSITAALAELAREVFTIELIESLSVRAREVLQTLGYGNIRFRAGDGSRGWPEEAPFDAIIVTAAAVEVPRVLEEELDRSGTMVVPVGTGYQELWLIRRMKKGWKRERLLSVRFVPLVTSH